VLHLCPCLPRYIESHVLLLRRVSRLLKTTCHRTGSKTLCRQSLYNSRTAGLAVQRLRLPRKRWSQHTRPTSCPSLIRLGVSAGCRRLPIVDDEGVTLPPLDGATAANDNAGIGRIKRKPRPGRPGLNGQKAGCRGMPSVRIHIDGSFAVGASSFSRHGSPRSVSCRTTLKTVGRQLWRM
jgi:hypothetical protein